MSLRDRQTESVGTFGGLKSGQPLESLKMSDALECQNFRLKEGKLERVNGSQDYSNSVLPNESGGITSIHKFKDLHLVQRGLNIALEGSEGDKTFHQISESSSYEVGDGDNLSDVADILSSSEENILSRQQFTMSEWRDRAVLANGIDFKQVVLRDSVIGSQEFRNIGLWIRPEGVAVGLSGGNIIVTKSNSFTISYDEFNALGIPNSVNIAAGTYYYVMTFYDANTNTESPGLGAMISQSGLTELSPNSVFGPGVQTVVVAAANGVGCPFSQAQTALNYYRALYPNITHFLIYRSTGAAFPEYNTFYRVPYVHASSSMNGQTFINIDRFLAEGLPWVDDTATADLPLTSLAENNGAPPSIDAMYHTDLLIQTINAVTTQTYPAQADILSIDKYSAPIQSKFFRDQLFCIGAKSPGRIVSEVSLDSSAEKISGLIMNFSSLLHGSEVYQPDYWPYVWEVGVGDGQDCTGIAVIGDAALLIFKDRSTYYLSGSSPDNYVVRVMDTSKGCLHRKTIQEVPNGVICLDRSGFVAYNKIGLGERISKDIQDIIDTIDFSYLHLFHSSFDQENQRYYCSVVTDGNTTPDTTLCLDLDSMGWTIETGQIGSCRIISNSSDGVYTDLVGDRNSGLIKDYSFKTNVTDRGGEIESIWTSGPIDFGDRQHRKRMQYVYITGVCASSWEINIEVIPDYDPSRKFVVEGWDVESSMSQWSSESIENLLWGEGNWASNTTLRKITKIPVVCTGYVFQVRIVNKSTNADAYGFEIHNVSCEGIMFKR